MALDSVIRSAIATANTITRSLQSEVVIHRWIGQDGFGNNTYAAPLPVLAIVEQKQRLRVVSSGPVTQTIQTIGTVQILEVVPPHGATGRSEPIDSRDRIVLPDGSSGPIVDIEGMIDPTTSRPYFAEIWLGIGEGST